MTQISGEFVRVPDAVECGLPAECISAGITLEPGASPWDICPMATATLSPVDGSSILLTAACGRHAIASRLLDRE